VLGRAEAAAGEGSFPPIDEAADLAPPLLAHPGQHQPAQGERAEDVGPNWARTRRQDRLDGADWL
jgi:hypothetical protein